MPENIQVIIIATLITGQKIKGTLSMMEGGYRSRVTDLLNSDKQFIPLKDVFIYQGQAVVGEDVFVALNKNQIVTLAIENYKDTEI